MSNRLSRACTLFVVVGAFGIGACASPSGPSGITSGNQAPGAELGQPSVRAVASGLPESATISPGVTDTTLGNIGWECRTIPLTSPSLTVCAPPGLSFPPRPALPNNGGAPSYTVWAFYDGQYHHRVKFIRPDLYKGQPCQGDEPYIVNAPTGYFECIIPAR